MKDGETDRRFVSGEIAGVVMKPMVAFNDSRGWLAEIFRNDELEKSLWPVMGYVSATRPGVARGPHEHRDQTDLIVFLGSGSFRLYLWDNRPKSKTYNHYVTAVCGEGNPVVVIIPPGVVHAYRSVGEKEGWVINCPNRLYRGKGRKAEVDEIRWEDRDSPFVFG